MSGVTIFETGSEDLVQDKMQYFPATDSKSCLSVGACLQPVAKDLRWGCDGKVVHYQAQRLGAQTPVCGALTWRAGRAI